MRPVLMRLAQAAPVWRRGRTRRTLRRIGTLAAVIGLALAVPPLLPTLPQGPAAADGVTIPERFGRPYPWQATVGTSPNGPALAYFPPRSSETTTTSFRGRPSSAGTEATAFTSSPT